MTVQELIAHEAADLFPMMPDERLAELAADIRENGLREPIRLLDGRIIDGRNRYRACKMAGVSPRFEQVAADQNPWAFVWSLNGQRRDLSRDQRYLLWDECSAKDAEWQAVQERIQDEANRKRAEAAKGNENAAKEKPKNSAATTCGTTVSDVRPAPKPTPKADAKPARASEEKAKAANVDRGTVERNEYLKKNRPDLAARVKSGELTSSQAHAQAKKEQRAKEIAEQREAIAKGEAKLPDGQFEVVVMDPPWAYGREYDPEGSRVANPYPEMTQAELMQMEPPFAGDAVLFLWTTHQFIWDAKALMDRWGFTYKATLVWDKEKMGMGAWFRMQCEFCLLGVRGKPTWQNTTWRDVIREPRRQHSRKPDAFYQMVEECTVGRRLEMFSREQREGWGAFGNDTAKF